MYNNMCMFVFQKPSPSSVNKDVNSLKDDNVFKAPPPPPKVTKSVTLPTEPHTHTTTAEQKEVSIASWET